MLSTCFPLRSIIVENFDNLVSAWSCCLDHQKVNDFTRIYPLVNKLGQISQLQGIALSLFFYQESSIKL